ncbi:MAG: ferrochelatase [candidate division Zixibacteria bacterium]|nr:ferrochelatase [candidate division Zixibacteria bacterium]
MNDRLAVILLAMGGPATTAEIPEYLFNIFSDRNIIRLPGGTLLQKPFARMISRRRTPEVTHNYSRIGGGSPLLKWTEAQARLIEQELRRDFAQVQCYAGMRYSRPTIDSAIVAAVEAGFRKLVLLPLYPQFSKATTGSSFTVARESLRRYPEVAAIEIRDFHDAPGYTALLREYITNHIRPDETLLFSAHSLPQKFVDEGDPYVDQIRRTAELAAGGREHFVAFQSRTGPVKWVGPDTIDEVKRLLSERRGGLFIVPIAFVCDHIETLFEIDLQLPEIVGAEFGRRLRRMPMFNDDQRFGAVLAEIVRKAVSAHGQS